MRKIAILPYGILFLSLLLSLAAAGPAYAVRPRELIEQGQFGNRDAGAPLMDPSSIWFDRYRNRIIVTSTANHRIMIYTPDGGLFHTLGKGGGLEFPLSAASDRGGNLYISEKESGRIKILRHYDETPLQETQEKYEILPLDTIPGDKPVRAATLAVGRDDRIYVIDAANHRVLVLDPDGSMVRSIGARGLGMGEFLRPADICTDESGRIYVTDPGAQRVLVYTREGKFLYRLGRDIQRIQGIDHAEGIIIDRFNNIWMSDSVKQNIFVEDGNGNRILTYPEGIGGSVFFFLPVDLTFDTMDRLYVLEKGSNSVRVFQVRY